MQEKIKLPFKEMDVIWWELMPINLGDSVRIIKTGKEGIVIGMDVPVSYSGNLHPKIEYYLKTTYDILIGGFSFGEEFGLLKRWEIEKVNR